MDFVKSTACHPPLSIRRTVEYSELLTLNKGRMGSAIATKPCRMAWACARREL